MTSIYFNGDYKQGSSMQSASGLNPGFVSNHFGKPNC